MKKYFLASLLLGLLQTFMSPTIFIQNQRSTDGYNNNLLQYDNTIYLNNKQRIHQVKNNQTVVFLDPKTPDIVKASEIAQLYTGDWQYAFAVQVLGYTATDDLWTIIGYNHIDSDLILDAVQLTIHGFDPKSTELETCIQNIIEKAEYSTTVFEISIK